VSYSGVEIRLPYRPRPHQVEVAREIARALRRGNVLLHAPTGFGKTPVVLAALIPYMRRGYRVVWAVRTGSETDRPVEELRVFAERLGVSFLALSYRGKRDMCLLAERYGRGLDYSEVSYICSRERRRCPYYKAFKERFDPAPFEERGALTYSDVYELSRAQGVCPYYAQRELLAAAQLVALSYNYVVSRRFEWSIRRLFPYSESILVVDEAHNLQNLNLESDTITEGTLERAAAEAHELGDDESEALALHVLDEVRDRYSGLGPDDADTFTPSELLPEGYFRLLEKAEESGEAVRRARLARGERPRSSLYHMSQFFLRALELEGEDGIAFIAEKPGERVQLSLWDMRSAEVLAPRWRIFRRVIFMSGTLEPVDAFAETVGVTNYVAIRVPSLYDEANARVYLTRDLSTRGEELDEEMAARYVDAIARLLGRVRRNTAVFTASYRVQARLMAAGLAGAAEKLGYMVFEERRGMSGVEAGRVLRGFKEAAREGRGLLVAPMGGRFAEGADFPGEELMAVFLAGIPFDRPTVKTRLYIEYYERLYGEEKGRLYAYIIPALRRASQALGRALRSPRDKAVIVLGDYRYRRYMPLLPDYVRELARPLLSEDLDSIDLPW